MHPTPLIVYSRVRWDGDAQRPRQLASRIATWRDVLFVEEPTCDLGAPSLDVRERSPRLRVARSRLAQRGPGFNDDQVQRLEPLLRSWIEREGWTSHAAWLDTPMAVRLARGLDPIAIVYDCWVEPAMVPDAPAEVAVRECELLRHANAVFTSRTRLYRSRRTRHPFVRYFPTDVVGAGALERAVAVAEDGPEDAPAATWDRVAEDMNAILARLADRPTSPLDPARRGHRAGAGARASIAYARFAPDAEASGR